MKKDSPHSLKNQIKLVIFDLDGTLVNAYEAIVSSLNYTLRRLRYPPRDPLTIRRAVGWGDEALIRPFVKKKDLSRALNIYRSHHRKSLIKKSKLLSGAGKVLEYLKQSGYKLAVASNRPRKFSLILMRHLKIDKFFDFVLCGDQLSNPKPAPEILIKIMRYFKCPRRHTLYLGDMHIDIRTANNARVTAIGVAGGSSTVSQLKKQRPYRIIKDISSLSRLL